MRTAVARELSEPFAQEVRGPTPDLGEIFLCATGCVTCHSSLQVRAGSVAFPSPWVLGRAVSGSAAPISQRVSLEEAGEVHTAHVPDEVLRHSLWR